MRPPVLRTRLPGRRLLVPSLLAALLATGCGGQETPDPPEALRPEATQAWPAGSDSIPGTPWTREDWEIFTRTLREAEARGLDTLSLGEAIAEMGSLFLGTPYVPRTLEVPGPERLVVNLRGLDCVTFVENALALTRFHRVHGVALLDDPAAARSRYEADLAALRYRDGRPDGYASRLHYFSEWIARAHATRKVQEVTTELGGAVDPEAVDFMSNHPDAYDQLADPAALARIREAEAALARRGPRSFIPQDELPRIAPEIRTGDVIAATSTVAGLDVAHTGIALWKDGELHLLHAPLVGSTVVLSQRTLPDRIRSIDSQDGVMVARPQASWFTPGG